MSNKQKIKISCGYRVPACIFSGLFVLAVRCYRDALAAGFARPANFRAFLSSSLQDLPSVVYRGDAHDVPIVNLLGDVLFDNWDKIFNGNGAPFEPWNTPIFTFNGTNVMTSNAW